MIMQFKHFYNILNIALILAPGYDIYGMQLNEGHFSSGTVIIHFLDKPYQGINFKSHLNSVLLCK